jgi:transcriptional regulator with XRE-family HTH domain
MSDLQQTMGTTIRRERHAQGLTLKGLAERAALSVVYLGEIERGKKYPSALVLEKVAEALELSVPDLLERVAEDLRGVRQPAMALGFVTPPMIEQPARTDRAVPGTGGRVLNMLVA